MGIASISKKGQNVSFHKPTSHIHQSQKYTLTSLLKELHNFKYVLTCHKVHCSYFSLFIWPMWPGFDRCYCYLFIYTAFALFCQVTNYDEWDNVPCFGTQSCLTAVLIQGHLVASPSIGSRATLRWRRENTERDRTDRQKNKNKITATYNNQSKSSKAPSVEGSRFAAWYFVLIIIIYGEMLLILYFHNLPAFCGIVLSLNPGCHGEIPVSTDLANHSVMFSQ